VVDITGTGFLFSTAAQHLWFVAPTTPTGDVEATNWFALSDTEIWAEVPAGLTAGTTFSLKLVDGAGGNTAGGTFLSTSAAAGGPAGGCAPTIASFTPTCGSAGDVVTITGTNLLDGTNLSGNNSGGDVFFSGVATKAAQPVPDLSEPTSISAIVPTGVTDGPIRVETDVDTNPNVAGVQGVISTTAFLTPPPDCVPEGGNTHARKVSLSLSGKLKAKGKVSSTEDPAFTECVSGVPVKIQRKTKSGWKNVGSTTTTDTGSYSKKVKNKAGKYRAIAKKVSLGDPVTDVCSKATSPTRKH
jgi:hypothetical protein